MENAGQSTAASDHVPPAYEPPAVTYLGDFADLTRAEKTVGLTDGSTFLGLDIGS
jgi:hypothetical protein